eukprot:scaffold6300_cov23-Tisochrysis_lutea.AAC.3
MSSVSLTCPRAVFLFSLSHSRPSPHSYGCTLTIFAYPPRLFSVVLWRARSPPGPRRRCEEPASQLDASPAVCHICRKVG